MNRQTPKTSQQLIADECDAIKELLLKKNLAYGDAALNPLRVLSKASPLEQLLVRADDKLSRLARGDGSGNEDAEQDLLGYLVLIRVARKQQASVCTCDDDDSCSCDSKPPTVPEPKLPADWLQQFKGASIGIGFTGPVMPSKASFDANGSPVEIPSANKQLLMEGEKAVPNCYKKPSTFCGHISCRRQKAPAGDSATHGLCSLCDYVGGLSCSRCWEPT